VVVQPVASCIRRWTFPWRGSRADQRFQKIRRMLYLHRNYYNGIWHYKRCSLTELTEMFGCITRSRTNAIERCQMHALRTYKTIFCRRLPMLQRGLSAIADLLVLISCHIFRWRVSHFGINHGTEVSAFRLNRARLRAAGWAAEAGGAES